MRAPKTPSVPALQRGLAILERIASPGADSPSRSSRAISTSPRARSTRLVLTFERQGYLQRDEATGRYMTGLKLVRLASMTLDGIVLRERATPLLRALVAATGMTAHLAILDRDEVRGGQDGRPGTQRVATWIGKRMDIHCTSLGKCLMAHLPDAEVDRLIGERGLLRHNENTIVSPARLKQELARTRMLGYAMDDEEEEMGGRCIGAPVWNWDRQVVAAVSVAGRPPDHRGDD